MTFHPLVCFALATLLGCSSNPGADETDDSTSSESSTSGALDDVLRLNHVQVKGTHNSYHQEPDFAFDPSHEYSHAPLDEQLEVQGVRQFELDVHKSPGDGSFLEVYHINLVDPDTSCARFTGCLNLVKAWSDANPTHLPIFIWIEVKDETGGGDIDDYTIVDDEIRSVFDEAQLLTPDDVQADFASPRERIDNEGWPTLGEVRGQVMFVLLESGGPQVQAYTQDFTSLQGKAAFVLANGDHYADPWGVVTKINDPTDATGIAAAHQANLIIAANGCGADQDLAGCENDLAQAKANGVHMLGDDFPWPVEGEPYFADFSDGNPARCNEVTAPPECTAELLEDL